MKPEITTLNNGINVIFIDTPGLTSSSVQMWFNAGSTQESEQTFGIAHFLEHMFFKGTKTRPGHFIAKEVENFGGEINAFTSFDYTCYYINSPAHKTENSVDILMDMVANPMFNQEDFSAEKEVVFEEYLRSVDNPRQYSFFKVQEEIFQKEYGHPILGTPETIKSFNREMLLNFRSKYYNKENAFLVVAGDLSKNKEKIIKTITSYELPSGQLTKTFPFEMKKRPQLSVHEKDVNHVTFSMYIPSLPMVSPGAPAEDLALATLGSGETSPLHERLVYKSNLVLAATAGTMFMKNGGMHSLRFMCAPENLSAALDELYNIINDYHQNGFSKEEIKKIKQYYIANKIFEKESIEAVAFSIGHGKANYDDLEHDENFIKNLEELEVDDINNALRSVFQKTIHISIQVPKGTNQNIVKKETRDFSTKFKWKKETSEKNDSKCLVKSKFDQKLKAYQISNNVTLIHRPSKLTKTFSMHIYAQGGITDEKIKDNGIYNIMSSLIGYGPERFKSNSFKKIFEEKAANLSTFAGKNAFGLTLHALSKDFDELSSLMIQAFLNPSFKIKDFKSEVKSSLEIIEAGKTDPVKNCIRAFTDEIFNGHAYRLNGTGTEKSLKSLTIDMIKKKHNKALSKSKLVITLCGDVDYKKVSKILSSFKELKKDKKRDSCIIKPDLTFPKTAINKRLHFDREQTHIMLGIKSKPTYDKEAIALKMLTTYLSGQSSVLFVEVRDKLGLCYTAQPIHFHGIEGGYWGIYIGTSVDKEKDAVKAIHRIIDEVKNGSITKKEFELIKEMIKGQNMLNIQTNDDYASIYSIPFLHGMEIDFLFRQQANIEKFTYDNFQKIIKKVLSRKWIEIFAGRE